MDNRYFPVFVPSKGKKILVVGGGTIAERRVLTLLEFDFQITVVSPRLTEKLRYLADQGKVTWTAKSYETKYIEEQYLILACTDDRGVNLQIGLDAKEKGILVSVCDSREECTFYFPAVAAGEEVTAGIVGTGENHSATKRAAAAVREIVKGKAY